MLIMITNNSITDKIIKYCSIFKFILLAHSRTFAINITYTLFNLYIIRLSQMIIDVNCNNAGT